MRELEKRISEQAVILPGDVLKVGSFFNINIDTRLLYDMGKEIADHFRDSDITKVLTIEASGIVLGYTTALCLGVPMTFAKKKASNQGSDCYVSKVFSFTHNIENFVCVEKEFIGSGDNILIVDDFLATGNALNGLIDIVMQAGAKVAGIGIGIEKSFQGGGDELRNSGYDVFSLAMIESMSDKGISYRDGN